MSAKNLRVAIAAPTALAWMRPDRTIRVLCVFERVCDLVDGEGRVVSLIMDKNAMGPFTILLAADSRIDFRNFISANMKVEIHAGTLRLGGAVIDSANAPVWQARPGWEKLYGKLVRWLPLLSETALAGAPPGSLAALLESSPGETGELVEDQIIAALRPPAHALRRGLQAADVAACQTAARQIAGLGGGLTPAGDDFLVGAIYALWATRPPDQVMPLTGAIISEAVPRTTRLSAVWLEAAGRGEAGAVWHSLIDGLVSGDPDQIINCADTILRVGHTSGADAMAGFIFCLYAQ